MKNEINWNDVMNYDPLRLFLYANPKTVYNPSPEPNQTLDAVKTQKTDALEPELL